MLGVHCVPNVNAKTMINTFEMIKGLINLNLYLINSIPQKITSVTPKPTRPERDPVKRRTVKKRIFY